MVLTKKKSKYVVTRFRVFLLYFPIMYLWLVWFSVIGLFVCFWPCKHRLRENVRSKTGSSNLTLGFPPRGFSEITGFLLRRRLFVFSACYLNNTRARRNNLQSETGAQRTEPLQFHSSQSFPAVLSSSLELGKLHLPKMMTLKENIIRGAPFTMWCLINTILTHTVTPWNLKWLLNWDTTQIMFKLQSFSRSLHF